jgi:putative tricarboxylic transport membrane protein
MMTLGLVRRVAPFVIVLGFGIWLWTVANDFAIATTLGRAGPDLWPKIILALLIGAALWGALDAAFKGRSSDNTSILITNATRSAGHEEDARKELEGDAAEGEKRPIFAILGIASMLGYVAVIPYLGFIVSTFLLLLAIMIFAGYERRLHAALISLIGALVFFIVFQRIVYVSLPMGAGPFREMTLSLMALLGVR